MNYTKLLNQIILCDIDGTISKLNGRHHRDYTTVKNDTVNQYVKKVVNRYAKDHSIVFLTGRREVARADTIQWFKDNDIHYDALYMKPDGELIKNIPFKDRVYNQLVKAMPDMKVTLALDDWDKVIELWNSKGVPARHVT